MSDASLIDRVDQMATQLRAVVRGCFRPFGAEGHGFRLLPPLTESQVRDLEGRYQVALSAGYRAFITRVANGEAGPAYGMYSLEEALTKERRGPAPNDILST